MDLIEAIKVRKSIRGFKADAVSKEIILEILQISTRAPSGTNCQPWEFTVITGDVLENVCKTVMEKINSGTPPDSEQIAPRWAKESVYHKRRVDLAKQIFRLMEIVRDDKDKRDEWLQRGFRYFDAPAAIIISIDKDQDQLKAFLDIGSVMQTICLTALSYDLGTCIARQGIMYPDILRTHARIPDSKNIVISIAIGYPDWQFPANKLESEREDIDSITTWMGF